MDRIGVLGGTFNPPHLGHSTMADVALESCRLDRLLFLPTGTVPHKNNLEIVDAVHRVKMVEFLAEKNSKFSVCDIEVAQTKVSYTAETLEKLSEIYMNTEIYFILGADSLNYIDRWYRPDRIFKLATICVIPRAEISVVRLEEQISRLKADFDANIVVADMPLVEISSTDLRRRIRDGKDISDFVSPEVDIYIKEHELYV